MNPYLTLEDILADEPAEMPVPGPAVPQAALEGAVNVAPSQRLEGGLASAIPALIQPDGLDPALVLPPDVQRLVEQREELARQVDILTGKLPSPEEDPAFLARFPIHKRNSEAASTGGRRQKKEQGETKARSGEQRSPDVTPRRFRAPPPAERRSRVRVERQKVRAEEQAHEKRRFRHKSEPPPPAAVHKKEETKVRSGEQRSPDATPRRFRALPPAERRSRVRVERQKVRAEEQAHEKRRFRHESEPPPPAAMHKKEETKARSAEQRSPDATPRRFRVLPPAERRSRARLERQKVRAEEQAYEKRRLHEAYHEKDWDKTKDRDTSTYKTVHRGADSISLDRPAPIREEPVGRRRPIDDQTSFRSADVHPVYARSEEERPPLRKDPGLRRRREDVAPPPTTSLESLHTDQLTLRRYRRAGQEQDLCNVDLRDGDLMRQDLFSARRDRRSEAEPLRWQQERTEQSAALRQQQRTEQRREEQTEQLRAERVAQRRRERV